MSKTMDDRWAEVEAYVGECRGIAWDTCHKIYILMDEEQIKQMEDYEYDPLITSDDADPARMMELLHQWYDDSCGLRFINAVETVEGNPNDGFTDLIPQFADEDEDEDDEDE